MLKMRVAYILPSDGLYGDNRALLSVLPHLREAGVEPLVVVVTDRHSEAVDACRKQGFEVITTPARYRNARINNGSAKVILGRWKRILTLSRHRAYNKVKREIAEFRPDIIHTNCSTTRLGYKLAKDLGVPHLWHVREYGLLDHGWDYLPSRESFVKKLNARANHSVYITDDILRYFGSPATGSVAYDGVFDERVVPQIKETDKGYFLFAGRLVATKGVEDLIRTYLQTAHKLRCPLFIAGTGDKAYTESLKAICTAHPHGDKVKFLGFCPDVMAMMADARALIVPSRFEAFGFITAEAMYNGCPVIAHNTAGTKLQLDNGEKLYPSGVGFRYDTPAQLADHLRRLDASTRADHLPMLRDAQKATLHYYTSQASARTVLEKYKDILAK